MARRLYTLAIWLLLPLTPLYLWWRARRQPEYRLHWRERYARYAAPPARDDNAIWIHAVSVGETRAAAPLVAALRQRLPDTRIVLTHMTPTGRATGAALFGDQVQQLYLPYDTPGAARRFLRHVRPRLGLFMETELWPNLLAMCAQAQVPTALVNARLSEASAAGYARLPTLSRQALRALSAIGAQGVDDAQRLTTLGALGALGTHGAVAPVVTGNLPFDISPPDAQIALGAGLRQRMGTRPVWLCASTREGEEALIFEALRNHGRVDAASPKHSRGDTAPGVARPLMVVVPRHPQRFNAVAALAAREGFRVARRSDNATVDAEVDVLIGDSMGEMFAYYAACDVAFVGGSLLDFGCQNLIEPCALGVPVLLGPSTFNFAQAAQAALACGAARSIDSAAMLVTTALALLADTAQRDAMGAAGRAFSAAHRGATACTLALLEPWLPAPVKQPI